MYTAHSSKILLLFYQWFKFKLILFLSWRLPHTPFTNHYSSPLPPSLPSISRPQTLCPRSYKLAADPDTLPTPARQPHSHDVDWRPRWIFNNCTADSSWCRCWRYFLLDSYTHSSDFQCCVNVCVAWFPQRPKQTLSMSLTSLSRLPVPRLWTSPPSANKVRVDPDIQTASSHAPVLATSAAVERPSTIWSPGTLCAAVDSRATRSSAAPNKPWVSVGWVSGRNWHHNPKDNNFFFSSHYFALH